MEKSNNGTRQLVHANWGNNPQGFKDMCLNNFGKSVPQSFYTV